MVQLFACLPQRYSYRWMQCDAGLSPVQVAPRAPNGQSHHVQIRVSRDQFANHRPRIVCKGKKLAGTYDVSVFQVKCTCMTCIRDVESTYFVPPGPNILKGKKKREKYFAPMSTRTYQANYWYLVK